jgi:hypothetical protein
MDKSMKITRIMLIRGYWIMIGLIIAIRTQQTSLEEGGSYCGLMSAILILDFSQTAKLLIWTTDVDKLAYYTVPATLVIAILEYNTLLDATTAGSKRNYLTTWCWKDTCSKLVMRFDPMTPGSLIGQ